MDVSEEAVAARACERIEEDASTESAAHFVRLAVEYLEATRRGTGPVSTRLAPAELATRFAEALPRGGMSLERIAERLRRDVIADANRLHHPMYVGHQVSAPLPAAVWTELVIAALNQSLAVWEMSPTLSVLESQVVRWFADLAGFGPDAGGTLTSGGTEATFTALLAARAAALPNAWVDGVGSDPPVIVCGEHAHYAVTRAAGELGLGMRSAVTVASEAHRMSVPALERTLADLDASDRRVMAVVATAGHTATGSFDDLEGIADACDRRGIWLHVDGAHGASALLSPSHAHRVRGISRARSLAWDPHKMLLLPLSAGMVLVRDARELSAAFAQRAPYLFHGEAASTPDHGPSSFQCSRRGDVLKLWVALQRYGADGLGALYHQLCDRAATLHALVASRTDFESLHAPECNILCFRWRPEGVDPAVADELNLALRERYNRSGDGWLTTTILEGRRTLRVTIMNPRTSAEQLQTLLEGLAAHGRDLLGDAGPGLPARRELAPPGR